MMNMNILKDKVIVVIGASSGIGASLSKYFSQNGANVCIYARREDHLKKISDEMNSAGYSMIYGVCDATDSIKVSEIATDVVNRYGKIDVWINCAGQNKAIGKVWEMECEDIWNEINIDLKSSINGTHAALKQMVNQNFGIIINFCGGGAAQPHLYAAAYSASKTAIARFTESVSLELKNDNSEVRMFAINPGLIYNERTKELCESEVGKKYMPEIAIAFKEGRCSSFINVAHFIEYAIMGKMDSYNGRLLYTGSNLDEISQMGKERINTESGYIRLIK